MSFLVEQNIKVLGLDIDGTLYPKWMLTVRMIRSLLPSVRLARAFNKSRKEYRRIQDLEPIQDESREGLLNRQASLVAGFLGGTEDLETIKRRVDTQFYQSWERSFRTIKPYEGMQNALRLTKEKGIKIAVFSDFPLADKLKTLGIEEFVDVAFSAEQSGYLKPSGKAFAFLLSHLHAAPDEVLYVGDSYEKDCQGAKGAGMYSCLITKGKRSLYPDADLVVDSWKEFASLVL